MQTICKLPQLWAMKTLKCYNFRQYSGIAFWRIQEGGSGITALITCTTDAEPCPGWTVAEQHYSHTWNAIGWSQRLDRNAICFEIFNKSIFKTLCSEYYSFLWYTHWCIYRSDLISQLPINRTESIVLVTTVSPINITLAYQYDVIYASQDSMLREGVTSMSRAHLGFAMLTHACSFLKRGYNASCKAITVR